MYVPTEADRRGNWGEVPNEPLRDAVLEAIASGRESWGSICRRMGWTFAHREYINGKPDHARLKRSLGLLPTRSGGAERSTTVTNVRYATAVAIVEGIGLDPIDFGL